MGEIPGDQIKVLIIDGVNNHDWEMTTEATKATLEQTGRFKVDVSTSPRKRASKEEWNAYRPAKVIPRLRGHHKGWIDAIKSGQQVHGGFDYSGPMTETVLLGAVALRTGKKLYWDSENMKATNAPEADKYIKPAFREGWSL
ncbi:MAG: hypothetical protein KAY65_14565 [Planctomycetes bacterium]|nr:hypothetical protein [Planctomycetota bacterium]